MKSQVMVVTPELAEQWLLKNPERNKKRYSATHADAIADLMRCGEWVDNGVSICFDASGDLLDGQHRLNALVKSGESYPFVVTFGVSDPRAFRTYNIGDRRRTAAQLTAMLGGVPRQSIVNGVARVFLSWERSKGLQHFSTLLQSAGSQIKAHEVAEKSIEIAEEVGGIAETAGTLLRDCGARSIVIGTLFVLRQIDKETTDNFIHDVRAGQFSGEDDPCLRFRERMRDIKRVSFHKHKAVLAALTIKAWNAYKLGKPMKTFKWAVNAEPPEAFPAPVGMDRF